MLRCLLLLLPLLVLAADDGFVLIQGGLVRPGSPVRVDDFEIQTHPVTNAEYSVFVQQTGFAPPLHWEGGRVPAGMAGHPVVFVNRYDVAAYLKWRGAREKRRYRLPTQSEFEYAARGSGGGATYPWGSESPEGKANYDSGGQRTFAQWRQYLKPVKSYPPARSGLYDMAGNVWQMVEAHPDPATMRFTYRVLSPEEKESSLAGGSWARSAYYLRCGVFGGASSGIRHPDIGFRLVREPAGSSHFARLPRRVVAAPASGNAVYIGWQLLASDAPGAGFHVYRSTRRDAAGDRITTAPVTATTDFTDRRPPASGRFYYRVRAAGADGKEGPPSEWAGIDAGKPRSGLIAVFESSTKQGGATPVFGDLNGDGLLDVVLRLDNGIREMTRDPGVPVEVEALTSWGSQLWRRPLVDHGHSFGNANNIPVAVYDLDADGKAEVICRTQEGDDLFLAVLDGMTGKVLRKTPWTPMVSDFARTSTRVHLSVGYLDGKTPAIITQTGLYENEIYDAYDANLKKLWTYRSLGETNGSGSHHVDIADVDGDGRDEVFNGTTLLNPDGTMRWSIYREHPDIVAVKHILPNSKDLQVYYAVESGVHAGAYLVDARSGKIIWKVNREDDPRWVHAHVGWASDIWEGSPGMEMLTNRDGHESKDQVLFAAGGKIILNPFPPGWRPVNWTGGAVRELMSGDGRRLGRFNGREVEPVNVPPPNELAKGCSMTADLAGDYRDEVVCFGASAQGTPAVYVFSNIEPAARREITRTANREYRLWLARNMGAGYASYFEWQP